jgi:hypothetical protein
MTLPFRVVPVSPTPVFRGTPLPLLEAAAAPPRASLGGLCITGLHVWPSTLAALRHLETLPLPLGARYLDISAGAGLLALALAAAGGPAASVFATELPSSLPLLAANAAASAAAARITPCAHAWGAPLPPAATARGGGGLHLAVACDVLHCAVRDGAVEALAATLAEAALAAEAGVLVVWEVRSAAAEAAALARAVAAGAGALEAGAPARLSVAGLRGRGVGHPDGDIFLPPSLFPEAEEVEEEEEGGEGEGAGRVVLACILRRRGP